MPIFKVTKSYVINLRKSFATSPKRMVLPTFLSFFLSSIFLVTSCGRSKNAMKVIPQDDKSKLTNTIEANSQDAIAQQPILTPTPTPGVEIPPETPVPSPEPSPEPSPTPVFRVVEGQGSQSLIRKNLAQLTSSYRLCLGTGPQDTNIFSIKQDMISTVLGDIPDPQREAELTALGRVRFLLNSQYFTKVNSSILETERASLDGGASSRTGTVVDQLEDESYLRSLATIANVVAWNCDLSTLQCDCSNLEKATAMMSRCLPLLNPASKAFTDTAALLASESQCASLDPKVRRKSIASLISSYAFAVAK